MRIVKKKLEQFTLTKYQNPSGKTAWRVQGYDKNGKRIRKNFKVKADALKLKLELEEAYEETPENTTYKKTTLSDKQLAEAEAATGSARGIPLSDIVSRLHEYEKMASTHNATVREALLFFQKHYRPEVESISVNNARQLYLEAKSSHSLAAKTIEHHTNCLKLFDKFDPNKELHTFTVNDIEKILSAYKNTNSKKTYLNGINTFFNWAVRHHYCLENPCDRLDKIQADMTEIGILTLDEVKKLLKACIDYQNGVCIAPIAIALFAGLRPSEIADLKPEHITKDGIRVAGGKLRRKLKRVTPMPDILWKWLEQYPFTGLPQGWDYKRKHLKAVVDAEHWVQDVLRHTSITYQFERDKNQGLTAINNGTSAKMIDMHYRNIVEDPKHVKEFWSLTPDKIRKAKIDVQVYKAEKKEVNYPPKAKLKKMVESKPVTHIANELGVSDHAVRKHCKKLDIELPKRGHWAKVRA